MKKIHITVFLIFLSIIFIDVFSVFAAVSIPDAVVMDSEQAQSTVPATPRDFRAAVCIVIKLALDFIPYLVVIAVAAFLQGLVKYVGNGDNEEKRSEGRKMMIYGIFGFFMMVSVWGILGLFTASFGLDLRLPQFKANQTVTCGW